MTKDAIITLPNNHLRERSKRLKFVDDSVNKTIDEMTSAALDWEDSRPHEVAVALAAVQIDVLERVVIVRNDFENKEDRTFMVLIDPEITKYEGTIVKEHEGCLSVKDVYGLVPRHTDIRVKALNEHGREVRFRASGFLARVLQHEIDHTNGIVFVDHIDQDRDAFFELSENGDLSPITYEQANERHIFRD